MADQFTEVDNNRLRGALGSLEQAAFLISDALDQGKGPLAASFVQDAEKLADGASVLLSYVHSGEWE